MSTEQFSEKKQSEQFLVFLLDKKNYGFPILKIDGIISIPKINPMPKTPKFMKGVINVRGQIIPIIDLRLIFGMNEIEYNEQTCVVLIKIYIKNSEKLIGFVVDTVSEVFDIPVSEIDTLPSYGTEINGEFLKGVGKVKDKIIMLLNIDKIIDTKENADLLSVDFQELNEIDS